MRNNIAALRPVPVVLVLILALFNTASAVDYDPTYDLFDDGHINWKDLDAFTNRWLNTGCSAADWCGGADFDHSSEVDSNDFALFALHWWLQEAGDANLVGWYKLDESAGSTACDSSEYGYDGTLAGGASWEPTGGIYEGAARFHGDDERVAIPNTGICRFRGTITLWGRLEGEQTQHYRFFFGDRTGGENNDNRIQLYMKDNTVLCVGLGGSHSLNTNIMPLTTNRWYHIALTWGGGGNTYVVYVDGDDKATGTHSDIGVLTVSADIGNSGEPGPVGGFRGLIDDVGIWDRVLDSGEILDVFNNGIGEPNTSPPGEASNPNPTDTATGVSINADLSWTAGDRATSHDVYFGTDSTPDSGEFQGNQPGTTFDPCTMSYSTTYYWRIDEKNAYGTTTGEVWSFTTESLPAPPGQASDPNPSHTATDVSISANLSWTAGSGATSHDVYFGTDSTPDAGEFQGNQPGTVFDPGTMALDTTYYWRIDEKNAGGTTTGIVWSFTTEAAPTGPGQAIVPRPFDTEKHVSIKADLEWTAGVDATSHDVYFGTNESDVNNGTGGTFQGNQPGTTFDAGTIGYETTYYWRIDEKSVSGTTTGDVWSFTTGIDFGDISWATVMSQPWSAPSRLDDFIDVHPRYLLTASKAAAIKAKVDTPGTMEEFIWLDVVKPKADSLLGQSPPGWDGEGIMRDSGRGIPWLALAYLMADEPNKTTYKNKAISWMMTVCGYSNWDNDYSLGAGEGLVGVSIGYDWLHSELVIFEKDYIRDKLELQANRMVYGDDGDGPQQREVYLANHCHVEYNGLGAAGFVLYDDANAPDAMDWIKQADLIFQTAFMVASDEGSSASGHQYWGYTMESLLCFTEAAKDLMDVDYYTGNSWLEGASDFIIFSTIPDFNMVPGEPGFSNCVMAFGDSHRDYRSHGPTHILTLLAARYDNGYAQWLAEEMLLRGIGTTDIDFRAWGSLLWYDDSVGPNSLSELPTFKHFEDIGMVVSRSGWDEDAVMVGFKCSDFHGQKLMPYYERQSDGGWSDYHGIKDRHCHPDVDSFQVYAHGKWLATEPGYAKPKYTYDHCTILAGGLGQLGEGETWFNQIDVIDAKATSTIIKSESTTEYDYIIGDAENIYRDSGLSKFLRHFIYIKPDVILIVDELEASPSSNYFEWRLRTTHKRAEFVDSMNINKVNDDYYIIENNNDSDVVVMDVHFVHPGLTNFSTSTIGTEFLKANFDSTSGGDMLAVVLHPRRDEESASSITSSSFVDSVLYLTVGIGAETINVELDLVTQEVTIY